MNREKIKLKENKTNDKELIEIIKEKDVEINEYKRKLKLAQEEIDSIKKELNNLKQELNNSIQFEVDIEETIEIEENKGPIPTLVLGEASMEYEESDECFEDNNFEENYKFFGEINIEANNEESIDNKNNIEIVEEVSEESTEDMEELSEDSNDSEIKNIDNDKLEDVYGKNDLIDSNDENTDENNDLLENLKVAFIENKNYECIEILNDILENISSVESSFTYEDSIILIYLSYFYSKLEDLLNKSKVINNYYLSESEEIKLFKMLLEEKEYPIYKESRKYIYSEIKNNKQVFKNFDTLIKVKIIDKINNISYRDFEFVYSINDIEYGEETINIKAWVKEKNGFIWRLVEGLYCDKKEKLYMLDSSIYILKLNINSSIKEEKQYEKKENNFFREADIKEKSIVTKNENKSKNVVKDKIDSNDEINKEKQIENTVVNKKIISENQNDEVKNNHNKWFNFKEKIALRLKKAENK